MTKLTTEITIEELQYRIHAHENDLTQMWTADYFLNVQKELLALKQAAKNPVAWTDSDELEDANKGYSAYLFALDGEANKYADPRRKIMLYAAPVLPKQPELVVLTDEQIDAVLDSKANMAYIISDKRERLRMFAREIIRTAMISTAPAQPVIPEGLIKAINRLLDNDGSRGCFDALEQHRAKTELERLLAEVQQNEPQNIPENIPAQPVSEPYKFPQGWMKGQFAYQDLFNAIGAAVVSKHPSIEISVKAFEDSMLAAAPAQDGKSASTELPNHFNLSTNSPVIPDGWKLVPIEPTENMIIEGFESEPNKTFSKPEVWEKYAAMSGCKQAAHRAKLCWAAMLAAAPTAQEQK